MTIVDVNLLLYAHYEDSPQHSQSAEWLAATLSPPNEVGLAWPAIWAFIRVGSSTRIWKRPATASELFAALRRLLSLPNVRIVEPGARHIEVLEQLVENFSAVGPLVSDAVLAALAIEHDATLASTDRDFARFPSLQWTNPLA